MSIFCCQDFCKCMPMFRLKDVAVNLESLESSSHCWQCIPDHAHFNSSRQNDFPPASSEGAGESSLLFIVS
jgi:hypothetical protein